MYGPKFWAIISKTKVQLFMKIKIAKNRDCWLIWLVWLVWLVCLVMPSMASNFLLFCLIEEFIFKFQGSQYYRFNSDTQKVGKLYPYPIRKGWPGVPDNIDAVFTDQKSQTYFLKGDSIYKFDNVESRIAVGYPKNIQEEFPSAPSNVDSAFRSYFDGELYFLKGMHYWKWNEKLSHTTGPFISNNKWKEFC